MFTTRLQQARNRIMKTLDMDQSLVQANMLLIWIDIKPITRREAPRRDMKLPDSCVMWARLEYEAWR